MPLRTVAKRRCDEGAPEALLLAPWTVLEQKQAVGSSTINNDKVCIVIVIVVPVHINSAAIL
jgi:hypothetical protein